MLLQICQQWLSEVLLCKCALSKASPMLQNMLCGSAHGCMAMPAWQQLPFLGKLV